MVFYKTEDDLEIMRAGAQILGKAHGEIASLVKEGVSTKLLDRVAEEFIKDSGASPSFKGYNGFSHALCISVNDEVVHGIPSDYQLRSGDIISVDCGVYYKGFHTDSAYTHPIGEVEAATLQLLEVTKDSLYAGIDKALTGNRLGDISQAIQSRVEREGYSVVRELVGHGVGKSLHEGPEVPNYGKRGQGLKLMDGLVLAIEPMVNLGGRQIVQEADGWTIRTRDRKPSAHFEHTVVVRKNKAEILTTFEYIDKIIK